MLIRRTQFGGLVLTSTIGLILISAWPASIISSAGDNCFCRS